MSSNWQIVLLHTKKASLLKRAFEAAFPGQVISKFAAGLGGAKRGSAAGKQDLLDYFKRHVYDPGIWKNRVLTIYGDGDFHHFTYALTRLACARRGLHNFDWSYFHFDNHRDDWGSVNRDGTKEELNCANFVDQIAHDSRAIPFFVGPDTYPKKDSAGYQVKGTRIPIYHNYLSKALQRSRTWRTDAVPRAQTGLELPVTADLRETPTEAYFSFDLDLLAPSEIVTNFDQNENMTLRRLCKIVDRIRPHKRVFSADILGFPDWNKHHALSCLTMIVLARKMMGLGVENLLRYHTYAKRRQGMMLANSIRNKDFLSPFDLDLPVRKSSIVEGELMENLKACR